jgi:hypothetical protein
MSPENSRKWRSNLWNADGCGTPQTRLEFVGTVPKAKSSTLLLPSRGRLQPVAWQKQRDDEVLACGRSSASRYRISCESYSQTMALLLFGGPHSSHGNWFGLRCSRLLFHLCFRTLQTFATEAVGKLAAIIRVNLGVVLGS